MTNGFQGLTNPFQQTQQGFSSATAPVTLTPQPKQEQGMSVADFAKDRQPAQETSQVDSQILKAEERQKDDNFLRKLKNQGVPMEEAFRLLEETKNRIKFREGAAFAGIKTAEAAGTFEAPTPEEEAKQKELLETQQKTKEVAEITPMNIAGDIGKGAIRTGVPAVASASKGVGNIFDMILEPILGERPTKEFDVQPSKVKKGIEDIPELQATALPQPVADTLGEIAAFSVPFTKIAKIPGLAKTIPAIQKLPKLMQGLIGLGAESLATGGLLGATAEEGKRGETALTGAIATPLAVGAGKALSKAGGFIKNIIKPDKEKLLTSAIKPSKKALKNFDEALDITINELKESADDIAKATDPLEALDTAIRSKKKAIWSEVDTLIKEAGGKGAKVDLKKVGGIVDDFIKSRPDIRTENPQLVKKLKEFGKKFAKEFDPEDIEKIIEVKNAELAGLSRMNPVEQAQLVRTNPEIAMLDKFTGFMKNKLDDTLELATGAKSTPLKKRYGALANVGKEVGARKDAVKKLNLTTLQEQLAIPEAFAKGVTQGGKIGGVTQIIGSQVLKRLETSGSKVGRAFSQVVKEMLKAQAPTAKKKIAQAGKEIIKTAVPKETGQLQLVKQFTDLFTNQ